MTEKYVADAHAFASYLIDTLPARADKIFKDSETERCGILVPSIALAESLQAQLLAFPYLEFPTMVSYLTYLATLTFLDF